MDERRDISALTLPNDLFYLPALHAYAGAVASGLGFKKDVVEKILLALEEAVTNVVQHAFEPGEKASFQVIFEPLASGIRIIVKDKGLPFASLHAPEYVSPAALDEVPSAGLGSLLMKKSVDELTIHNLGRDGKEVHLVKYLPYKSIVESVDAADLKPFPKPWEGKARPADRPNYRVRLMEPSEALEVPKLFYRAYGYSYVNDVIYYPEKFACLHADGHIVSVVAVSDDGKVIGHIALMRDSLESKLADTGMAAVQPDYRGQGCQEAMIAYLTQIARDMGLMAIYSEAVTSHPYAQKAGQKAGFRRCALILGFLPSEVSFKGINETLARRGSVICGFLPLANPPGITLYPPEHHEGFIREIYGSLGLTRDFARTEVKSLAGVIDEASTIKTRIVPLLNNARIDLVSYGKNAFQEVRTILKELCLKKVDQITLMLSLEDPLTGYICPEFEKLGFFVSGVLPFTDIGDALILQYLNNVPIDYEDIQLASDMAIRIRSYVQDHDPQWQAQKGPQIP